MALFYKAQSVNLNVLPLLKLGMERLVSVLPTMSKTTTFVDYAQLEVLLTLQKHLVFAQMPTNYSLKAVSNVSHVKTMLALMQLKLLVFVNQAILLKETFVFLIVNHLKS